MTDISVHTLSHHVENRSWYLGTADQPGFMVGGTLDISGFTSGTHYPNGFIKSGEPLAQLPSGLYVPYVLDSESVSIAVDATGGTFTITIEGQATAAIAFNATAAAVQAAVNLLPGIRPGDITWTGGPGAAGGATPYVGTWGSTYAGLDAPAITTGVGSLTGGAGTAAVTTTAGGGETPVGEGTGAGFLYSTVTVPNVLDTTVDVGCAVLVAFAPVKESKLPRAIDAAFRASVRNIYFVGDNA
ncbi:MAG: Phage minor tail protein [Actinomycetia bacterium]|nr:Phage minor tail protein [Actinomycetes bacterium]